MPGPPLKTIYISSGVTSSGLTLDRYVHELVEAGGRALSNTIDAGGLVTVESGGTTRSDTVASGGVEVISSGGRANFAVVSSAGLLEGHGALVGADVFGELSGLMLSGYDAIESGGTATSVLLAPNGYLVVQSGGEISGAVAGRNSEIMLSAGGSAFDTLVSGPVADAEFGASADGVTVQAGGVIAVTGFAGPSEFATLTALEVLHGGTALIEFQGATEGARIGAGGVEQLDGGSQAEHTEVFSGGTFSVNDSGYALSSLVHGSETVSSDGQEFGAKVFSGGVLEIAAGGAGTEIRAVAGGTVIDDGYMEYGESGRPVLAGTLSGSGTINEEGYERLVLEDDGSAFTGELTIGGHLVELASVDALGDAPVVFYEQGNGDPTLQVDAAALPSSGAAFANVLSGFNQSSERLDLASLTFTSGATARINGDTLTLKDGTYIARFTLAGPLATRYAVASDGQGGTLVHAAVGAGPQVLGQAAAAFSAPFAAAAAHAAHDLPSSPSSAAIALGEHRRPAVHAAL